MQLLENYSISLVFQPCCVLSKIQFSRCYFELKIFYYFSRNGKMKYTFEGENNKKGLITFMEDPTAQPVQKPKEIEWSSDPNTEIVHLNTQNFESSIKDENSMLIMFHAPCKCKFLFKIIKI